MVTPQTVKTVPHSSSEDGSVSRKEAAPEVRPASPVMLFSTDEAEEEEYDQTSGQGSFEMDTQDPLTPEVELNSARKRAI